MRNRGLGFNTRSLEDSTIFADTPDDSKPESPIHCTSACAWRTKTAMKLKFLFVLVLLLAEVGYSGRMVLETRDPEVAEAIAGIPGIGDYFYEYRIRTIRETAKAGDVHQMLVLFHRADALNRQEDRELALQLLKDSETATAELFVRAREGRLMEDRTSREFMLLVARSMKENIRPYVPDGDENVAYTQQSLQYARAFEILESQAASGDRDAAWIMQQIGLTADDQPVDESGAGS
jgi:hypothetical protein